MKIENINISELIPYANNAKEHPQEQIGQIASSISEFGFNDPIAIDDKNVIIEGHGRLLAAQKLGLKEVPIIRLSHLNDYQKKAYIIAHNKLTMNTGFDEELLQIEMDFLKEASFDLEMMGFDEDEMLDFMNYVESKGNIYDDEVPEIDENEEPRIKLGDLIELGEHRVLCGDSTKKEDVKKLMDGKKASMVFTSPPYNANAKTGDGDIFNGKKAKEMYKGSYVDNQESSEYIEFAKNVLEACFSFTNGYIYWNVSYNAKSKFEYVAQIQDRVEYLIEQVCWKKSSTIPFKGMLMRDWEPIYVFSTNRENLKTKNVTSNFWEISNTGSQQENHKACFPVALVEKAINITPIGNNILLEPFLGSGSTLIACEKTKRKCYGIELDEHYCDVIIQRYCEFTDNYNIKINGKNIDWRNYN